MVESLFPAGVVAVEATGALWEAPLLPLEAACVAGVGPRRRQQFAAGRACARQALARLGLPPEPLLQEVDRSPRWPAGVRGSISHTEGRCAAAVARGRDLGGLGLDIERIGRVTDRVLPRIATRREREWLARLAPVCEEAATLLFSAKESVYKCLGRPLARPLGWHDVEIELDLQAGAFGVQVLLTDVARGGVPARLEGRFALEAGYVATGLTLPLPHSAATAPHSR